jgi:hypothetical protein
MLGLSTSESMVCYNGSQNLGKQFTYTLPFIIKGYNIQREDKHEERGAESPCPLGMSIFHASNNPEAL